MLHEDKIWIATKATGEAICLLPQKANRHVLITGLSNKEVDRTARILAEGFSSLGTPVFITDINRDLAGMMAPGNDSESIQEKVSCMELEKSGFCFQGFPVTLWDVSGETGIPLRANIGEMGPVLLSQIMQLSVHQSDTLKTIFRIADSRGLSLISINDTKAIVNYIRNRAREYEGEYGQIKTTDLDGIMRALVRLESEVTALFWGETALNIGDLIEFKIEGKGMINVLEAKLLVRNRPFYASVLLWLLSELCESLPEAGELNCPKMAFIIDEANLLFRDNNRVFIEKTEQVIRKLSKKGVSVIFCTQKMQDIPDNVLRHLENRIQHSPYAYTPAQLKEVRCVASLFRKNPAFDTFEALTTLTSGEALLSLIGENNLPCPVEKGYLLPPQSYMGRVSDTDREHCIKGNILYSKYARRYDSEAAYNVLKRIEIEEEIAAEKAKEEADKAKELAKREAERFKEEARREQLIANVQKRVEKSAGNSVSSPKGKTESVPSSKKSSKKTKRKSGKMIGGNLGERIGRGIIGTLFKN